MFTNNGITVDGWVDSLDAETVKASCQVQPGFDFFCPDDI